MAKTIPLTESMIAQITTAGYCEFLPSQFLAPHKEWIDVASNQYSFEWVVFKDKTISGRAFSDLVKVKEYLSEISETNKEVLINSILIGKKVSTKFFLDFL